MIWVNVEVRTQYTARDSSQTPSEYMPCRLSQHARCKFKETGDVSRKVQLRPASGFKTQNLRIK
jgi:hypothetical protein